MKQQPPIVIEPAQCANPMTLEFPMIRRGMIQKFDLRSVINISDASFRKHVQAACDSDPDFLLRYEQWRHKKFIPIPIGAELIIGILGEAKLVFRPEQSANFTRRKKKAQ